VATVSDVTGVNDVLRHRHHGANLFVGCILSDFTLPAENLMGTRKKLANGPPFSYLVSPNDLGQTIHEVLQNVMMLEKDFFLNPSKV
jgi:hypothetical protein